MKSGFIEELGLNRQFINLVKGSTLENLCHEWNLWKRNNLSVNSFSESDVKFLRCWGSLFSHEYYEGGGLISPYFVPYRWDNYDADLVHARLAGIINSTKISLGSEVVDFGCGVGFYMKGLLEMGYRPQGIEVSQYALNNCHPGVCHLMNLLNTEQLNNYEKCPKDLLIAKDVLEHIPNPILPRLWGKLSRCASRFVVVVPFVDKTSGFFVNTEDEHDLTHVVRKTRDEWFELLGTDKNDEQLSVILKPHKAKGTLCIIGSAYDLQ